MDMGEFDNDKSIEPGELDVEAVQQADLFFKWAERAINAKAQVDLLEFEVESCEARLQIECRENPTEFGLEKVTEAAVTAAVKTHKKYIKRVEEYFNAKKEAALLNAAVQAMEQKKRMLEVLITLHGQEYFAGPSVPRSLTDAWRDSQLKRAKAVQSKQKEKVRSRHKDEEDED